MEEKLPLSPDAQSRDGSDAGVEKTSSACVPTQRERLFAWLLLPAGYLFWCAFPMSRKPLGAALLLAGLYLLSFCFILRGRVRFGFVQKLVLLSAFLAVAAALLWDERGNAFLCFLYCLTAYAYLVYAAAGNTLEEGLSVLVGADLVRALLVFPFSSFGKLFPALALSRGRGAGRTALRILLGLFLAVLPTYLVLVLLSYDDGFASLIDSIFSFDAEKLTVNLLRAVFAIPVAMYCYGLYDSSVSAAPGRRPAAAGYLERAERRRIVPAATAAAAVIPLFSVYVIYFISQWEYYTSAFTGVLPEGLSYAGYAREGFFQLCAVAGLNFIVLICLDRFVRRAHARTVRVLSVTLALFTLVLIGTAVSKLWLYISRYGLTPDRVYAAWFLLLLSLLFALVIVGQFFPSVKTLPLCLAATVALFLLLVLSGPDRRIAEYNVDRYISGESGMIDIAALDSLGEDAVPDMLRLEAYMAENSPLTREEIADGSWCDYPENSYGRLILCLKARARAEREWYGCTLSHLRCERALRAAGFLPLP